MRCWYHMNIFSYELFPVWIISFPNKHLVPVYQYEPALGVPVGQYIVKDVQYLVRLIWHDAHPARICACKTKAISTPSSLEFCLLTAVSNAFWWYVLRFALELSEAFFTRMRLTIVVVVSGNGLAPKGDKPLFKSVMKRFYDAKWYH